MSKHVKMTGKGFDKPPPPYNAWESVKDRAADGKYERVITSHFAGDDDDIFMRSMIMKYAEKKYKDGSPSSGGKGKDKEPKFILTKDNAKAAACEVIGTHMGLTGDALGSYLATYYDKAWGHFDVNQTGEIDVERAPQLMRFLMSDQYISLQGGRGQAVDNDFAASGKDKLASAVDRLIELYELRLAMMLS